MKGISAVFAVLLTAALLTVPVSAGDYDSDIDLSEVYRQIPEDVRELLPREIFDRELDEASGEALGDGLSEEGILSFLLSRLTSALPEALKILSRVLGILILAAAYRAFCESYGTGKTSQNLNFALGLALILSLYSSEKAVFTATVESLTRLTAVLDTLFPIYGITLATGGSAAAATADTAGSLLLLTVCENAGAALLLPLFRVSFGLLLCSAVTDNRGIEGIGRGIVQAVTVVLTVVTTLILSVMGVKTLLASGTDGLAAKAAKLALGQAVPVVGGAIGDSVSAIGAGISVIRGTVGAVGIVVVLLLTLPNLITLFVNRGILALCALFAGLLGCEKERKILGEAAGLTGLAISVSAVSAFAFFLATVMFLSVKLPLAG